MTGNPTTREVRLAGLGLGLVAATLGCFRLWQHRVSGPYLFAVAVLVVVVAVLFPAFLRPFVRVAMRVGERIAWALSRLALVIVFYAVVTPVAVIGRLLGARFSDNKFTEKRPSYWHTKVGGPTTVEDYGKQY